MQRAPAVVLDAVIVEAFDESEALLGSDKVNLPDARIRSGRDDAEQALIVVVQAVDRRFMVQIGSEFVVDSELALVLDSIQTKVEARGFGKDFEGRQLQTLNRYLGYRE